MQKILFTDGWEVTEEFLGIFNPHTQWQPVQIPHDASIAKPRDPKAPTGKGGGYAWSGVLTYRKSLNLPDDWRGQQVLLEFEGAYQYTEVSINQNIVAMHPYGYTSFHANLTPYLTEGDNQILVRVNNSAQPNSRWYSGTGIYRHVWARVGAAQHIAPWGVFVTTPTIGESTASLSIATELVNTGAAVTALLRSIARDPQGEEAARVDTPVSLPAGQTITARQHLLVADPQLWSLEQTNLYTLESVLMVDGQPVDHESTSFGIRSIAVDSVNGFRLNGVPMKLKGGCVHHDNGLLGAASYDRAEWRKIELMKSAGYNAIRCAHNPPAPAMLEACDRLGMLVIDESFDCWRMGKTANDYHLYFQDWWQRDTESMVKRDRNHPSIIMWSIGNEVMERAGASDGYAWARKQADFVRSLDPTRWVNASIVGLFEELIANPPGEGEGFFDAMNRPPKPGQPDRYGDLTFETHAALDVSGYNYYHNRYAHDREKYPQRVIAGTETFPYDAYATWQNTINNPNVIGDFVWTSIDYLGESGIGMVTLDSSVPFMRGEAYPYHLANCGDFDICGGKRPQSYFRDILWGVRSAPYLAVLPPSMHGKTLTFTPWGWEPVVESWSFPIGEGNPVTVHVYSAADEVELFVNNVSMGRKPAGAAVKNRVLFDVTYQPGELLAVAYTGGQESGRALLTTTGAPAALRIVPEDGDAAPGPGQVCYALVEVVDEAGRLVPYAAPLVTLALDGPGELVAIGTPDPESEELYVGNTRMAYQGRLTVVVRAAGPGAITLRASAEGLDDGAVTLAG